MVLLCCFFSLLPTLCWLNHGCSHKTAEIKSEETALGVWSAWSGYSPLCVSGEEWCLRLSAGGASEFSSTSPYSCCTSNSTVKCKAVEESSVVAPVDGRGMYCFLQKDKRHPTPAIAPLQLLTALLRRGATVESAPQDIESAALAAAGCCSLRLETQEGAAKSINLVIRKEQFERRDAVAIFNDTPLPLLVRQCRHKEISLTQSTKSAGTSSSGASETFAFSEAAVLGVDSVTSAVAELWEAAIQNKYTEEPRVSRNGNSSGVIRFETLSRRRSSEASGSLDQSLQLLNVLLENQQEAEKQLRAHGASGTPSAHSSTAVYISRAPHKEAVKRLLDRLTLVAEAIGAQHSALQEEKQTQTTSGALKSYSIEVGCPWCRFESAAAKELCMMEVQAGKTSESKDPLAALPVPQLVLPRETLLFAWDDYRNLPCIELSYCPWLQQQQQKQKEHSVCGPDLSSSSLKGEDDGLPMTELCFLDKSFVACIPLKPSVRGVVPLPQLPSSCWLLFRVIRSRGRLRLHIAPAGDLLGTFIPRTPAVGAEGKQHRQGSHKQVASAHLPSRSNTSRVTGDSRPTWDLEDGEQVAASPDDIDVQSLLVLPRYFQSALVNEELNVLCSRNRNCGHSNWRVPPWAFASMCRFAESMVGSYAPNCKTTRSGSAVTADISGRACSGKLEEAVRLLPLRPTPDPPNFELRIEVPSLQVSVLSQGAVTDPLSRQVRARLCLYSDVNGKKCCKLRLFSIFANILFSMKFAARFPFLIYLKKNLRAWFCLCRPVSFPKNCFS